MIARMTAAASYWKNSSAAFPRHGIDKSRCVRVHMSNAEYESVPFTIR